MPATAPPQTETPRPSTPRQPYHFSRAQYERMVDAGVFAPDQQVELINGSIVPMSPQNSRHAAVTTCLLHLLADACPEGYHVRSQVPLALGTTSEPEPDVVIVPGALQDHLDAHPSRALLVVEVADTSLAYDRDTKRTLYAEHGIPTYWIANLNAAQLEVYTDPEADEYQTKRTFAPSTTVSFADASVSVSSLLPDRPST